MGLVALVGCGSAGATEPRAELDSGALPVEGQPGELAADGQTARDASAIDSVVMIGDSITRGSIDALRRELHGLVGQWASRSTSSHAEVHVELRRAVPGPPSASAPLEVLMARRDYLLGRVG